MSTQVNDLTRTPTAYKTLFRIECLHQYFAGGACRSLALTPTEECRALLSRYQLLFRSTTEAGTVYALLPDRLNRFTESAPFTFMLTSIDANLDSYTDIDSAGALTRSDSFFYFDNRSDFDGTPVEITNSPRLLHPSGSLSADDVLPVRSRCSVFANQIVSDGNVQVLDGLSSAVLHEFSLYKGSTTLDLRRLPEGRYGLAMYGQESEKNEEFYLTDRPASRQWGAISIYLGGPAQAQFLPAKYCVLDKDCNINSQTFVLSLNSRKTLWRYYVIDRSGKQDFAHYEVVVVAPSAQSGNSLDVETSFDFAKTTRIDGCTAWMFESQTNVPLLQSPASRFSLSLRPRGNGNRGDRAIRLPYAQPGSLVRKTGTWPQQLCSEVFVYV